MGRTESVEEAADVGDSGVVFGELEALLELTGGGAVGPGLEGPDALLPPPHPSPSLFR